MRAFIMVPLLLSLFVSLAFNLALIQQDRVEAKTEVSPTVTPAQSESASNVPTPESTGTGAIKTGNDAPTSWYKDRNVMAGALQGLSALIAVLLGFGLSIFAERRAWKRRKIEQIRERQLSALLAFLTDIHELIEQAQKVSTELKTFQSSLPQLGSSSGRGAALEAAKANLKLREADWIKELDNDRRAALLRVTELRLLKIGEEALEHIVESMAVVEALISLIGKVQPETIATTVKEFDDCLQSLARTSDVLVESAIRSLDE